MTRIDYYSNFMDAVRYGSAPEAPEATTNPYTDENLLKAAALCLRAVTDPESLEGMFSPELITQAQDNALEVSGLIARRLGPAV